MPMQKIPNLILKKRETYQFIDEAERFINDGLWFKTCY